MRVLILSSEWPTEAHPEWAPFIVEQVASLREAGVDLEVYAFRGNKNPISYLWHWIQLRKRVGFQRFDLIHAHFGQSAILSYASKLPTVVTFHGSDLQGYVGKNGRPSLTGFVLKSVSKQLAMNVDEVILVSEHLTNFLPKSIKPNIIPCGIDFNLFRPIPKGEAREILGWQDQEAITLFVGNPNNPIKRHALAVEAVSRLRNHASARLVTICDVPHEEIPIFMNAADVLLLTSKHEGSPTVVKEALACNLAVVSVNVGDVEQRIGAIEGCVVCEDDRVESITYGLTQVLLKKQRIKGRDSIKDLELSRIAQKVIAVYKKALK